MSVRLLTREEIGLISSYIDIDIMSQVLKNVYDFDDASDDVPAGKGSQTIVNVNNRKRFALWLSRINSIIVNERYGVVLPAPTECLFYTPRYKKQYHENYVRSLASMLYQLDEANDDISRIFKRALRLQLKRLGEDE